VIEEKAISPPKPPDELIRALGMDQLDWFGSDVIKWFQRLLDSLEEIPTRAANIVVDRIRRLLDWMVEEVGSRIRFVIDQFAMMFEEARGFFQTLTRVCGTP